MKLVEQRAAAVSRTRWQLSASKRCRGSSSCCWNRRKPSCAYDMLYQQQLPASLQDAQQLRQHCLGQGWRTQHLQQQRHDAPALSRHITVAHQTPVQHPGSTVPGAGLKRHTTQLTLPFESHACTHRPRKTPCKQAATPACWLAHSTLNFDHGVCWSGLVSIAEAMAIPLSFVDKVAHSISCTDST
jgi:hypothetical protein